MRKEEPLFPSTLIYSRRGNANIWTDPHVSKAMLSAHLDPDSDGASRKPHIISKTIDWVAEQCKGAKCILDLGCGPGLYATRLAAKGFSVTGMDINPVSIDYARKSARESDLRIHYECGDYLSDPIEGMYDAAICIYCDFGALLLPEQMTFLSRVHEHLVQDGLFLFDIFGPRLSDSKCESRDWNYVSGSGFWARSSHFLLDESKHFPDQRAWGMRTLVMEDRQDPKEFITWDHYFTESEIKSLLATNGFDISSTQSDIVETNDFASDDVLFVISRKR